MTDQEICDTYTLPTITGTDLTGNQSYFTVANGSGTEFKEGASLTETATLFIYDETRTTPNCESAEQTVTIIVNKTPAITSMEDQLACQNYELPVITGTNLSGDEKYYLGNDGGGGVYVSGNSITSNVTLYLYDATGTGNMCADEEVVVLEIIPELQGFIESDKDCELFNLEVTVNEEDSYTEFVKWYASPTNSNYAEIDEEKSIVKSEERIFNTWYIAEFGHNGRCTQYDTLFIEGCPDPVVGIPNAMTVNGDGSNDVFFITNIQFYPDNSLTIYNRWGSVVYKTYGYENDCDGSINNSPLPVGTYFYVLNLGEENQTEFQGNIALLRP